MLVKQLLDIKLEKWYRVTELEFLPEYSCLYIMFLDFTMVHLDKLLNKRLFFSKLFLNKFFFYSKLIYI